MTNEQSEKEFITFHYIKDELVHEYQKNIIKYE